MMKEQDMTGEEDEYLSFNDEFSGYKILGEPNREEKIAAWKIAIGLQRTDGLTPSDHLIETANRNINGHITFGEAEKRLERYYAARPISPEENDRTEEADKVSARIADMISKKTFSFRPIECLLIHKKLFTGIYGSAGKIRDRDISKAEWVLGGRTAHYACTGSLFTMLERCIEEEKMFNCEGLTKKQMTEHLAKFVSALWQIHAFGEGNTRTTAVFVIKYFNYLGLEMTADVFAEHSLYFRNALVRADYTDPDNGIHPTYEYLDRFFGNLLLGEKNVLRNRDMHISADRTNGMKK